MISFANKSLIISSLLWRLGRVFIILISCSLASCEGVFDWVYDQPPSDDTPTPVQGQFYLDASDWKTWYYLDLPSATDKVKEDSLHDVSKDIVAMPIPFEATGDEETIRGDHHRSGQYMYYFDVFNEGISKNHFTSFTPTAEQIDPDKWTIAIHRNNVRTNACGAYETTLTDISLVTHEMAIAVSEWQEDTWSENVVWDDQSTMLSCYVPSQGIMINRVLSSWLEMKIPPMPPAFTMNSHVMLLRLSDGTFGALQLVDYLSATNKKCCLTIKYKYPV